MAGGVCVTATYGAAAPAAFTLDEEVPEIRLAYASGHFTCWCASNPCTDDNASGDRADWSAWGCGADWPNLYIVVRNADGDVVAPAFDRHLDFTYPYPQKCDGGPCTCGNDACMEWAPYGVNAGQWTPSLVFENGPFPAGRYTIAHGRAEFGSQYLAFRVHGTTCMARLS